MAIVSGVAFAYVLAFAPMYSRVGEIVTSATLVPLAVTSWLMGWIYGLLAALVFIPLNILLLNSVGESGAQIIARLWPGVVSSAVVAVIIGWISDARGELSRQREALLITVREHTRIQSELLHTNKTMEREVSERKEVEERLRISERQLRYLSSELIRAQENERKRIADEIHDGVGQSLHLIRAGIEELFNKCADGPPNADRRILENLLHQTDFAIYEVRNIYMGLRPSLLDDLGIIAASRWFLREFQSDNSGIRVRENITLREEDVPESLKIVLFRTLQGALDNVARHSRADTAFVNIITTDGVVELTVKDNGVGFQRENGDIEDMGIPDTVSRGIGLASMQERVETSGGAFSVRSVAGEGTTVRAAWSRP